MRGAVLESTRLWNASHLHLPKLLLYDGQLFRGDATAGAAAAAPAAAHRRLHLLSITAAPPSEPQMQHGAAFCPLVRTLDDHELGILPPQTSRTEQPLTDP